MNKSVSSVSSLSAVELPRTKLYQRYIYFFINVQFYCYIIFCYLHHSSYKVTMDFRILAISRYGLRIELIWPKVHLQYI